MIEIEVKVVVVPGQHCEVRNYRCKKVTWEIGTCIDTWVRLDRDTLAPITQYWVRLDRKVSSTRNNPEGVLHVTVGDDGIKQRSL